MDIVRNMLTLSPEAREQQTSNSELKDSNHVPHEYHAVAVAGTAQSVQQLTTGWTTEGSEFECWQGQEYSLLRVVEIGSEAHLASFPTGTGGPFAWGKAAAAWSWPLTSN
jgi:hypothetical protein